MIKRESKGNPEKQQGGKPTRVHSLQSHLYFPKDTIPFLPNHGRSSDLHHFENCLPIPKNSDQEAAEQPLLLLSKCKSERFALTVLTATGLVLDSHKIPF